MGMIAIQLAKLAGLHVVTTASERNPELLRNKYGADAVLVYNDLDCATHIRQGTGEKLRYFFDCISNESSARISAKSRSECCGCRGPALLRVPTRGQLYES